MGFFVERLSPRTRTQIKISLPPLLALAVLYFTILLMKAGWFQPFIFYIILPVLCIIVSWHTYLFSSQNPSSTLIEKSAPWLLSLCIGFFITLFAQNIIFTLSHKTLSYLALDCLTHFICIMVITSAYLILNSSKANQSKLDVRYHCRHHRFVLSFITRFYDYTHIQCHIHLISILYLCFITFIGLPKTLFIHGDLTLVTLLVALGLLIPWVSESVKQKPWFLLLTLTAMTVFLYTYHPVEKSYFWIYLRACNAYLPTTFPWEALCSYQTLPLALTIALIYPCIELVDSLFNRQLSSFPLALGATIPYLIPDILRFCTDYPLPPLMAAVFIITHKQNSALILTPGQVQQQKNMKAHRWFYAIIFVPLGLVFSQVFTNDPRPALTALSIFPLLKIVSILMKLLQTLLVLQRGHQPSNLLDKGQLGA